MDQRNHPYGMPAGRGMPNGMQQRPPQQNMQHYGMQDMMFDPLPMSNGMFHNAPMHQHANMTGLMQQQGMVAPEDDPRFWVSANSSNSISVSWSTINT
ncbi:hypothetical protein PHMEG_00032927 [Phytophthora megakarya]|uniref:Uncharacterized protein n=1 Tax=Phytophthora megakarya TaxID=4795 RepID=A0A225UUV2_9STRA|nr:hypothetical protein PHMEG_00032927 [Phytophthora megakarya]